MSLFAKYAFVFLISMVPLIELRGAIPYAVAMELPLLESYIIAILANMLPVKTGSFFYSLNVEFRLFAILDFLSSLI